MLSLILSGRLYWTQHRAQREASLGARLEQPGDRQVAAWLVITNHGPHTAADVTQSVQHRDGGKPRGIVQTRQVMDTGRASVSEFPIPLLHAKDDSRQPSG